MVLNYPENDNLSDAQKELYEWIKSYMKDYHHSPSIRQMMQAMGLRSPAPIQSRLKHLQQKGFISWQEGKARTLQIVDEVLGGVPIMGSVAAGGLIETYSDVNENLDFSEILKKKNSYSLRNGTIVSAMVPGLGTTLKYFFKRNGKIFLEAANPSYEPIELDFNAVVFQGKLLAVWRKV